MKELNFNKIPKDELVEQSTSRCKACNKKFSPRIIEDEEEDMCGGCISASSYSSDTSDNYEFIRGFMQDKLNWS